MCSVHVDHSTRHTLGRGQRIATWTGVESSSVMGVIEYLIQFCSLTIISMLNVKVKLRDLLISAPLGYILLNKFSTVYINQ